ncbi:25S rRNA (uracil(2634)-N(3))-methyltransferase [Malassezia caprae]|uniref:25S rRNA (Uracil(2634)-N(3))-methyltransferase n=1 Tax=Malassezia caprae TaxID=1381934 RepID=A0AAF0E9F2_9BASI|nr:25S rRNA (uracil(2634)-N(3))-methyltransferase [Malassezia caprae]
MAKRDKGTLRAALAKHRARSQQRADEKRKATVGQASKAAASVPSKKRTVMPFAPDDSVLLVGEGNFSFTLALMSPPHNHPPQQILATSYDTEAEVYEKYPDARAIITQIRAKAGLHADRILAFGVDAGALHKCEAVTGNRKDDPRRWSKVWFGFPHVGAGHKDEQRNVLANQLLLLRFLVSVAPYLTQGRAPTYVTGKTRRGSDEEDEDEDDSESQVATADDVFAEHTVWRPLLPPARQGSVLITIRNVSPYTPWNIPMLGKKLRSVFGPIAASAPPPPKGTFMPTLADLEQAGTEYVVWRSFEFDPRMWKGYSHRRTVGFVDGLSTANNEDLLRRTAPPSASKPQGRHVGTGECRTFELALR